MKINANFDQRVCLDTENMDWIDSPMPGVARRPLDRVGGEVARATSIVRYAPGSAFSPHVHTGGEEFIVLQGVFQDEHGDFPVGSYVRNPPRSSHTPGSESGCVIFVKLWQFDPDNSKHVRLNTQLMEPVPQPDQQGVSAIPLYQDQHEEVSLYVLDSLATLELDANSGAELLVLEGELQESEDRLTKHSWLRVPEKSAIKARAGKDGARVWIKRNHLNRVQAEIDRVTKLEF